MALKKGQQINLDITHLAFGGKGLAKPDGFAVFVNQAVPGDCVRVQITRKKKNYAEARVVNLLRPSENRCDPPCPYSGHCGGCRWQFLDYTKQLEYKRQQVVESLEHIGQIEAPVVHDIIPSDHIFGYRNKMEFSCSDRRWVLPSELDREDLDRTFALGLHVPGTFSKVMDIEACLLHPAMGNDILDTIRQYIRQSDLLPYGLQSHQGHWRFVMLRNSVFYGHWMVNIVTASDSTQALAPLADQLMEQYPDIVSVVNNITARKSGVALGESELLIKGQPYLKEKIDRFEFLISANSFFQTNTRGARILYEKAREFAELQGDETVLDLYSGTGTIAIYISPWVKQVIGIELGESSINDANRNCRTNNVSNCHFIIGDVREKLPLIKERPEVVVIDPPRAGMHKDVVGAILNIAPDRIVYVSCNPASLARDAEILSQDYELIEVQPVDMFPHTFHIEAVAKLIRKS